MATLLDHFGVRMDDLARLTDRQIDDLFYHPRSKEGGIEVQDMPAVADGNPTLKSELMNLWKMAKALKMPPEQWSELEKQLREKYAAQGETWAGQLPPPHTSDVILGDPM